MLGANGLSLAVASWDYSLVAVHWLLIGVVSLRCAPQDLEHRSNSGGPMACDIFPEQDLTLVSNSLKVKLYSIGEHLP